MGDIDVDPGLIGDHTTHWPKCWRYHHECSTAEIERLRSVVAGVEALAFELDNTMSLSQVPKNVARRLRSVLSDTKGDARVLVSTDPDDDHSRAYEAAVAAREAKRND